MTLRSKGQRAGDMRGSACRYHWTFSSFHWQNLLIIFSCGSDFYYTLSSAAWSSVEIGHQCTGQSVCLYFLPLSLTTSAWYNSFVFLLTLLAWYAEQGLWNGRASVCLSVPSIDSSIGGRRVCCRAPFCHEISIDRGGRWRCVPAAGALSMQQRRRSRRSQQMRAVLHWQPMYDAEHRLVVEKNSLLSRESHLTHTPQSSNTASGQSWATNDA